MPQGQLLPLSNSSSQDPLRPGTYQSLLPIVDEILSILHAQTVSPEKLSPAQASEQVAPKVSSCFIVVLATPLTSRDPTDARQNRRKNSRKFWKA